MREPSNPNELSLWRELEAEGWELSRNGWPDILAKRNGEIIAIEVKSSETEKLKKSQLYCMNILSQANIKCYRWTQSEGLCNYHDSYPNIDLEGLRQKRQKAKVCPQCGGSKGKAAYVCPKCEGYSHPDI